MKCFGIIPHEDSFRKVFRQAILPAAQECGLECSRAEEESFVGVIIEKIREMIGGSRLCVADVSGKNANVMIEIATRSVRNAEHGITDIAESRIMPRPMDDRPQYLGIR